MKKNIISLASLAVMLSLGQAEAQETQAKSGTDTLAPMVKEVQADLKKLKKIKISGYIQGQYQKAESKGIETFSGDDFPSDIDQRFVTRRGRLKTTYTGKLSEMAIQLDVTVEKGVALKEAYYKVTEPVLKTVSLQFGLFMRPFSHELNYSNTIMEYPERTRVVQNVLSGETDLGACLIFQLPKENPLSALRLDFGLFNGTSNKGADYDNEKDFIGRLSYNNTFADKYITLGAGISYFNGGTWNFATNYYEWKDTAFTSITADSLKVLKKNYMGADIQLTLDNSFGQTQIRGEMMWGTQPTANDKTKTFLEAYKKPAYMRDFSGGYVCLVQTIAKTKHQFVVKYDWYDPNTKVNKDEVGAKTPSGATNLTTKADIAYTTLGLGWIYNWDENVKITAYYDMVSNEKTLLKGYTEDLKDNVFTLRVQYKF
ncbi:MAG TPA: hypothetical protein PK252_05440 [Bacteroidales bacterium]|nr:hypothetical protein [Bacteroidales bacterium]